MAGSAFEHGIDDENERWAVSRKLLEELMITCRIQDDEITPFEGILLVTKFDGAQRPEGYDRPLQHVDLTLDQRQDLAFASACQAVSEIRHEAA